MLQADFCLPLVRAPLPQNDELGVCSPWGTCDGNSERSKKGLGEDGKGWGRNVEINLVTEIKLGLEKRLLRVRRREMIEEITAGVSGVDVGGAGRSENVSLS